MSWFRSRQDGVGPLILAKKSLSECIDKSWNKRVWSNIYSHKGGIACEYTVLDVLTVEELVKQHGSNTSVPCPRYEIMRTSSCEFDIEHNKIVLDKGYFFACRLAIDFEYMSCPTSETPDGLITRLCSELNAFLCDKASASCVEFYIMKCNHPRKVSYHVVLHLYDNFDNEFFFRDALDSGIVMKSFLKLNPFWEFAVDCSIYRSNSAFRLPYCSKPNGAAMLPQRVFVVNELAMSTRLFQQETFEDWLVQPTASHRYNIMKINRLPVETISRRSVKSVDCPLKNHPWFTELLDVMQKLDARFNFIVCPLQYRFEVNHRTCEYGKTHRSNHPWWVVDVWKLRIFYYCYDDECRSKYFDYENNRVDKQRVRSRSLFQIDEFASLAPKLKQLITTRLTADEILNQDSEVAAAFRSFVSQNK